MPLILTVLAGLFFSYLKIFENSPEQQMGVIDLGWHPSSDVMIRFERQYKGMKFQDAINFTQEEYDSLAKEEIIKMEDERFNNWINIIEHSNAQ